MIFSCFYFLLATSLYLIDFICLLGFMVSVSPVERQFPEDYWFMNGA